MTRIMKIVMIGSGNVATHMACALHDAHIGVSQVYSRNIVNARLLAGRVGADATDDVSTLCHDADVYIFSVKDDALPSLAQAVRCDNPDAVFLHTAGSVPMDVFKGCHTHYGVLYPMQTFSKQREVEMRLVPIFIEGNDDVAFSVAESLAHALTDSVHPLSSDKRKSLHLAAVFACNFTNHCYRLAERVLQDAGIDFSLYLPLIDCTARKVHDMSPRDAQTGPAVRYDETVINRHLSMLTDDTMRQIYQLMSESIHADKTKSTEE